MYLLHSVYKFHSLPALSQVHDGISFVPGSVPRLDWVQLQQVQGGPRFPLHFRAPAGSGGLVLSLIDTEEGASVDLSFLAGG